MRGLRRAVRRLDADWPSYVVRAVTVERAEELTR